MQYKIQFNTFAEVEYCEKYQIYNNKNKIKIKSINTKKKTKTPQSAYHTKEHLQEKSLYSNQKVHTYLYVCIFVDFFFVH